MRRLARASGVNLAKVKGTGRKGRILVMTFKLTRKMSQTC
ncbi:E3 binding domain-containing protein [Escherichia coli]